MKKLISLACGLMLAFALTAVLPSGLLRAKALTGSGTDNDPYVVMTYDELRELMSDPYKYGGGDVSEKHSDNVKISIRLGDDISTTQSKNGYDLDVYLPYDKYGKKLIFLTLDLYGHTLSRYSVTDDTSMFTIRTSYFGITDSVGGGKVVCDLDSGAKDTCIFKVTDGGSLTVTGGTFSSMKSEKSKGRESVIYTDDKGASLNIMDGTFTSYSGPLIDARKGDYIEIYNASFAQKGTKTSDAVYVNSDYFNIFNCTIEGYANNVTLSTGSDKKLSEHIPEEAVVKTNGSKLPRSGLNTTSISSKRIDIGTPWVYYAYIDITTPKVGRHPVAAGSSVTPGVIVDRIEWYYGNKKMSSDEVFKEGETYIGKVYLMAESGYDFMSYIPVSANWHEFKLAADAGNSRTYYSEYKPGKPGDVNGEGVVDIEDAVMVVSHINGAAPLDAEECDRADVDENSAVDIADTAAIISHVNGVKSIE